MKKLILSLLICIVIFSYVQVQITTMHMIVESIENK